VDELLLYEKAVVALHSINPSACDDVILFLLRGHVPAQHSFSGGFVPAQVGLKLAVCTSLGAGILSFPLFAKVLSISSGGHLLVWAYAPICSLGFGTHKHLKLEGDRKKR